MHLEFIGLHEDDKVNIEINYWNRVLSSVMKSSVTYLQNPYKSQSPTDRIGMGSSRELGSQ
jgi:hypothetical protein